MSDNVVWLDFNDAADQVAVSAAPAQSTEEIKAEALKRLPELLSYLLPSGRVRGHQFSVGDVMGNAGKSLVVDMFGPKAGMWIDFATGECGDVFALWAAVYGKSTVRHFPEVIQDMTDWLGYAPKPVLKSKPQAPVDDLGPYSGKWDYHNGDGQLIACVYRYDTPTGKEYRPWDVKSRSMKAPTPRPLYQQPRLRVAKEVVLVEGEKAADALNNLGIVATTAMNGASAPIDKTDWSPLLDKQVLIWPDKDDAGMQYAEKAAKALIAAGAETVSILELPADKPEKWDAADAVAEHMDVRGYLQHASRRDLQGQSQLPAHSVLELLRDDSPMPEDLIAPRVLTPGGVLVFGGAPKVGKSDFILSWLMHMAAGEPFLGMTPPRPLKVFYLQAEIQYHYLRERLQQMDIPESVVKRGARNLFVTPQVQLVLNEAGVKHSVSAIKRVFPKTPPDIIVIDPIRNVFDGGSDGGENSNDAMLAFLKNRVVKLRDAVNREAGIMLVHHTRKQSKKQFDEEPFDAFSGASSLRGYYSSGMLLHRPDPESTDRKLKFELRNGAELPEKKVNKSQGRWIELDASSDRLVNQGHGDKLDAERRRKRDVILQLIFDEASAHRVYTAGQFAEAFESRAGLGAERTIRERLSVLSTKGYIKFFRNTEQYGLPSVGRSRLGGLCVEGMKTGKGQSQRTILPTHYKCPQTGALLPVEDPTNWIYHEEITDEK